MQFKATLITNSTISIMSDTGQTAQINWPAHLIPDSIAIGDAFAIELSDKLQPRTEFTGEKSLEELRALLYDLIN